ncbi:MAG: DUF5317 family protein [Candidatus Dormibacteraceae bacterium]
MLWIAALAIGVVAGFAFHGSIDNLARLRFRWAWLVVAVLVVRGAILLTPIRHVDGVQYVYLAALTALVAWTVWQIEQVRGVWLIATGSALNLVVVAANGARMPVAPDVAGALIHSGNLGQYTLMSAATNLNWLADWIALPGPIGRLVAEAYSPGDVVVAIGIGVVIALGMRSRAGSTETRARIVSDPP